MIKVCLLIVGLLIFVASMLLFPCERVLAYENLDNKVSQSSAAASPSAKKDQCGEARRYTFSWPLIEGCDMAPRGGSTIGTPVTFAPEPSAEWLALQDPKLTAFERDRLAILAMAGAYKASFEFLETVGYTPQFTPSKPYQSWGTEYVYVIEEQKEFISLQHIMVLFVMNDGKVAEPIVMKHWRQDWQYQKSELLAYVGADTWQKTKYPSSEVQGTWAQAVYQVDDSPRYESFGRWQHYPNFSTWQSATTWRPLPRREHTVRSDYQVLEGYNRHTVVPSGWVQEEENYKVKLDSKGAVSAAAPYLAKELGVNRYQRVVGFDFSAGDRYWRSTGPFWQVVRNEWKDWVNKNASLTIRRSSQAPMEMVMLDYADKLGPKYKMTAADRRFLGKVFRDYVVGSGSDQSRK